MARSAASQLRSTLSTANAKPYLQGLRTAVEAALKKQPVQESGVRTCAWAALACALSYTCCGYQAHSELCKRTTLFRDQRQISSTFVRSVLTCATLPLVTYCSDRGAIRDANP